MLCFITYVMLYNMYRVMLCYITSVMSCYITYVMLYDMHRVMLCNMCHVI